MNNNFVSVFCEEEKIKHKKNKEKKIKYLFVAISIILLFMCIRNNYYIDKLKNTKELSVSVKKVESKKTYKSKKSIVLNKLQFAINDICTKKYEQKILICKNKDIDIKMKISDIYNIGEMIRNIENNNKTTISKISTANSNKNTVEVDVGVNYEER